MSTHNPHPSLLACTDAETTGFDDESGLLLEVAAPVDDVISLNVAPRSVEPFIGGLGPRYRPGSARGWPPGDG
ncbi:hypothetical protein C5B85_03365 [Pseudoclavibacter sp. AY1F1]|uniref:hypothetical protein n=1 Tax=Pseudoclavibacter sp. AY1F1 TaxID=2080583 RepID=UPI000CE8C07E|nr:hypothetical protein [Pseudoclavibacter sp. AY1F1]PPF47314.1 hypothetical protein C5B85_03365 [Pseudoclavibacter sp. AY1F1]